MEKETSAGSRKEEKTLLDNKIICQPVGDRAADVRQQHGQEF